MYYNSLFVAPGTKLSPSLSCNTSNHIHANHVTIIPFHDQPTNLGPKDIHPQQSHSTPCIQTSASSSCTSIRTPPANCPPIKSIQPSLLSVLLDGLDIENMMHATKSNSNDVDIISSSTAPTCSHHSVVLHEKAPIDYRALTGKTRSKTLL